MTSARIPRPLWTPEGTDALTSLRGFVLAWTIGPTLWRVTFRHLVPRAKRWRPSWNDPNTLLQADLQLQTWVREGLDLQPPWRRKMAT